MSLTVRFFASLRERLDRDAVTLDTDQTATVADAWRLATDGAPMPSNVLAAVNQEYATTETAVNDGDEIAFFPPVTGG